MKKIEHAEKIKEIIEPAVERIEQAIKDGDIMKMDEILDNTAEILNAVKIKDFGYYVQRWLFEHVIADDGPYNGCIFTEDLMEMGRKVKW